MTASQLELKVNRLTAKMTRKQLCKVHELIEEMIDARDIDRVMKDMKSGKTKWVSHEDAKAMLGLK